MIGYTIAAYFGERATCHPKYKDDNLFYIKTQLKQIDKLNTKIGKIYIVCTFDEIVDENKIISDLYELQNNRNDIIIITRKNLGGSYCSWNWALQIDDGNCTHMVLVEDDYTVYTPDSITHMLEYFSESPELFYLCQMWTTIPYTTKSGIILPNHAGVSNGMINNKLYHKSKSKGLSFQLKYLPASYDIMWENQALFLEPYRKAEYLIKDYRDKYKSTFCNAQDVETIQGNITGTEIFVPIVKSKF